MDENHSNSQKLVTLLADSRRTGITPKRLLAAIRRGELPGYQIGSWKRVRPRDVDEWIEAQRYPAGGSE